MAVKMKDIILQESSAEASSAGIGISAPDSSTAILKEFMTKYFRIFDVRFQKLVAILEAVDVSREGKVDLLRTGAPYSIRRERERPTLDMTCLSRRTSQSCLIWSKVLLL